MNPIFGMSQSRAIRNAQNIEGYLEWFLSKWLLNFRKMQNLAAIERGRMQEGPQPPLQPSRLARSLFIQYLGSPVPGLFQQAPLFP